MENSYLLKLRSNLIRGGRSTGWILLSVFLFVLSSTPLRAQEPGLPSYVMKLFDQKEAAPAYWSITVRDTTGKILHAYHPHKLMKPASNLKLLTSAAILDALGPEFRYRTPIYGLGSRVDSTWNGDLIIQGHGDPSISGEMYGGNRLYVFNELYRKLKNKGINQVNGNLIGNDAYFDNEPYPKGWDWNDLSFYYGVEISALSYNDNCVDLKVLANGGIGDTPQISWFPYNTDYVEFINEQNITPPGTEYDEYYRRLLGTNTILLRSTLPKGYVEKESLSIANPSLYFLDTFQKFLHRHDFEVQGGLIVDHAEFDRMHHGLVKLAEHHSDPLKILLHRVNKESDNFYTEMMLKTIAAQKYRTPGSTELGIKEVMSFADSMEIDTSKVVMTDGSGMSASTLISTAALSKLLVKMRHHPWFKEYHQSLSVAGTDGTLSYRFVSSPVNSKFWGKSGYISGVRAISGYLKTSHNKTLIVSLIANHFKGKTSGIDRIQDQVVEWLYRSY